MNKCFSQADFICPRRTETQTPITIHLKKRNNGKQQIKKVHLLHFWETHAVLHHCLNLTKAEGTALIKELKMGKDCLLVLDQNPAILRLYDRESF